MKKRDMKKWIPKHTLYCDGCKNLFFYKVVNDMFLDGTPVKRVIQKCRYTDRTTENDACLYDFCKCCNVSLC